MATYQFLAPFDYVDENSKAHFEAYVWMNFDKETYDKLVSKGARLELLVPDPPPPPAPEEPPLTEEPVEEPTPEEPEPTPEEDS